MIISKPVIRVVLVLVSMLLVHATASVARSDGDEVLQVTAKLVEIPAKFPPDDLYDYAYVMRYEVTGGPLDKSSILVAH